MKPVATALLAINKINNINELVQIIEHAAHKVDLKTISKYAKDNNMSYNGVKNNRPNVIIGGVKFVADGIIKHNLPF